MPEAPVEAWRRCRLYLEAALKHGDGGHDIEDVRAGIEQGELQFWPGLRCAVVTEILDKPKAKILNFWLLGGDLRELLTMRPHIEAWGRVQGCTRAIGGGLHQKRGWARVLASAGYRPRWTIFLKELDA